MSPKTYLWIEDRKGKASYKFWSTLMSRLFPEVIVGSKRNNSELVKAVKRLRDEENFYVIAMDNAFDNPQVCMERAIVEQFVAPKYNVFLLDLISFEYTLLEFDNLLKWIYAVDDEFWTQRASAIAAREKLVDAIKSGNQNYVTIQEVANYDGGTAKHNIEQISAKLLHDLTRNTGFEVSKGNIGDCWVKSCCEWSERQHDDMCGLDNERLSVSDKMKEVFYGTSLNREFSRIGWEVSL